MVEPLLELRKLSAGYQGHDVLKRISMVVPSGKMITIIGPNGHGKTTLLRTISGLVPTRSGEIRFAGERLSGMRPDRIVTRGIVHIPQGDMLFPEMTVYENLQMGAYLPAAAAEARRRLEEVFTLLPKLAERRRQVASTLSGGERRMVGIGRGLMAGGRILLIDEPSLGLAPIIIDQIYDVIADLRRSGRTILLVEENAARVAGISDKLYLLDDGQMVWEGQGEDLMNRPEILSTYLGG